MMPGAGWVVNNYLLLNDKRKMSYHWYEYNEVCLVKKFLIKEVIDPSTCKGQVAKSQGAGIDLFWKPIESGVSDKHREKG